MNKKLFIKADAKFENSRRDFVKTLVLAGVAAQIPWVQSCSTRKTNIPIPNHINPFSELEFMNLYCLLDVLFPEDGDGPGAKTVKADQYIIWILNDKELDKRTHRNISEGLEKVEKASLSYNNLHFFELSISDQEQLVADISAKNWGDKLLSRLLTMVLEALLLDSQYHVNPNNVGWKWLEHNPGFPRPTKEMLYPKILEKKYEI